MRKKILFGLAGIAIMAAAVCATVSGVNTNSSDSDLLTKNIEALTNEEEGGGDGVRKTCYARRGAQSPMNTAVVCGRPGCFIYNGYRPEGNKSTC